MSQTWKVIKDAIEKEGIKDNDEIDEVDLNNMNVINYKVNIEYNTKRQVFLITD